MEQNLKVYTGNALKVLNYLKGGATPIQAATAVGVDKSYVSQLCAEEDFQKQIAKKIQDDFEQAVKTDKNYEEIESVLAEKLKAMSPMIMSLDDILKTVKTVNALKRKTAPEVNPAGQGDITNIKIVHLTLPKVTIQNFITNPNSEIVDIDGTSLITLNSSSIDTLAKTVLDDIETQSKNVIIPKLQYTPPKGNNVKSPEDKWGNI